jgi:hypothetical protein
MSCKAYKCPDIRDSIGPDGECHPYDETLELRHEKLKVVAEQCALSVKDLNAKIKALTDQLANETKEKEELDSLLRSERLLSTQYKIQRDDLKSQLDENSDKLQQMTRNYELEQMSKAEVAK